jgi:hypothetical protein
MHIFSPIPDQETDIMRPINPMYQILPNDKFDPVVNMGRIPRLDGSPMDALSALSFADMILNA